VLPCLGDLIPVVQRMSPHPAAGNAASTSPGRSRSREPRPLGTGALNAVGTVRRAATLPISRVLREEVLLTCGSSRTRATVATTTTHPILQPKFSILDWAGILLQFGRTVYTYVNLLAVENKSERFQGQPEESGLKVCGTDIEGKVIAQGNRMSLSTESLKDLARMGAMIGTIFFLRLELA
jgi:hypothetical protein